ncbi:MAG TPA: alpha-amylase/4-alpha-glucanotransferase domain-containing protein [Candidatus Acidoferrales bacterium]|nr:alpha-amylase/4-alpha-glucanotransferase domain-containing protein [Candidatus Acidoferrales bacterium]
MSISVTGTSVGGMSGFVLENEKLRTVLMPEFGARIISIIYKPTETEFVWHNPRVPIMKPSYKPEFEDMSGLFDCVPTCENCTYKQWQLPMYGETASEPWRVLRKRKTARSITVAMQRKCQVYPLMVNKSVTITKNEPSLELNYRLTNLSNERLEYHYSGHNTLNINPNYRIILPPEVQKLKRGYAITDRLGNFEDEIPWPTTVDKAGRTVDLSKVGQPTEGTGENLYTPKLNDSWCAALNESRHEAIGFSFDATVLPYILVWINWGGYLGHYHIALEPSSGRPDNLNTAVNQWKSYSSIQPNANVAWTTRIFLAHDVDKIKKITPTDGIVQ